MTPASSTTHLESSTSSLGPHDAGNGRPSIHSQRASIFLQEKCFLHRFIRRRDTSVIVERPERLKAVAIGLAAALSRLEEEDLIASGASVSASSARTSDGDQLVKAMSLLELASQPQPRMDAICNIIHSNSRQDIETHPAVLFVHGSQSPEGETSYLTRLKILAADSQNQIATGESEIPEPLSQGDLYRGLSMAVACLQHADTDTAS